MTVKVGDQVRLTGPNWAKFYPDAPRIVTVTRIKGGVIEGSGGVNDIGDECKLYGAGHAPAWAVELLPSDVIADAVAHPPHYTSDPSGVECITITRHRNFNVGNAIKYLWRAGLKPDAAQDDHAKQVEDLRRRSGTSRTRSGGSGDRACRGPGAHERVHLGVVVREGSVLRGAGMKIAEDVYVIEHRRVQGGDWLRVQHVAADMVERAQDVVAQYNEQSGCGDWRIRPISQAPVVKVAPPRDLSKPSIRERVRFWWVMRFSKRGRA